jgi:Secretion system C-terminal sorting domain
MASQAFQIYPMRKIILLYIWCCSFSLLKVYAQTPMPVSTDKPIWNIGRLLLFAEPTNSLVFIEKDTFFCQKQWTVANFANLNRRVAKSIYFRQENGKVFFKPSFVCEEKEYLMYDFTLKPGDTLSVPIRLFEYGRVTVNRVIVRVDSVKNVIINGVTRKKIVVNYQRVGNPPRIDPYWDRRDIWLEGIGSLIFPFYPFFCVSLNECDEAAFFVRCFQSNNKIVYQSPSLPFCSNALISSNSVPQSNRVNLTIFPNPISPGGNWQVEWTKNEAGATQLELLDPLGRVLKQVSGIKQGSMQRVQVSTENLPKGLYYLRLREEGGQVLAMEKVMVQ